MNIEQLRRILDQQHTGSHVMIQIENQMILGRSRGQFISLPLNDPLFEKISGTNIIAIGSHPTTGLLTIYV